MNISIFKNIVCAFFIIILLTGCDIFVKRNKQEFAYNYESYRRINLRTIPNCFLAASSPDGKFVYVTPDSMPYDIIKYYRDKDSDGYLYPQSSYSGTGTLIDDFKITSDGKFIYFTTFNSLCFSQVNKPDGAIISTTNTGLAADKIFIPPDSKDIYAFEGTAQYIYAYSRNLNNGNLTDIQTVSAGYSLYDASFTPDGKFLYTIESSVNLYSYKRDIESGEIAYNFTFIDVLLIPKLLAISPDGNFMYIVSNLNEIRIYSIDKNSGSLSFYTSYDMSIIQPYWNSISDIKISSGGNFLILSGVSSTLGNCAASIGIDTKTGLYNNNGINVMPLGQTPHTITIPPDQKNAYIAISPS